MSRKADAPHYDDLINYPRAKDKDEIRCVMCGLPPGSGCVIPRQNKDVCKECDKSTWQHVATGIYFKWCKGCKKFLRLGSFSEKLDAAKCDRCRERGRQSYLLKKGKDGSSTGGRSRSNSITSMKSDLEEYSDSLDLAAAAAAMAAVAASQRDSLMVSSSSGDEADRDSAAASDEEYAAYRRHHRVSMTSPDLSAALHGCDAGHFCTPQGPGGRAGRARYPAHPIVIDDDSADVTKSKLSSVFGMPLRELTTCHRKEETIEDTTGEGGLDGASVSKSLGGTLYELACIHQRIMTLEEHAERVKQLESKVKEQQEEIETLKGKSTRLEEELMLSKAREETSHEEAVKLRAEYSALRDVQSNMEKREASLAKRMLDAKGAALRDDDDAKRPRLVSLGE